MARRNKNKGWKWAVIGVVALLIIGVGLLGYRIFSFVGDLRAERVGDATATPNADMIAQTTATAQARMCAASADCTIGAATPVPPPPTATPDLSNSKIVSRIKAGQRISVMYMGYGGSGHDGEYLTDTILVLSFDPKTQTVSQFNIPRDLYGFVAYGPNHTGSSLKFNNILSTIMNWDDNKQDELDSRYHWTNEKEQHAAGANLAANTVQTLLGFKIDYWVTMNFRAFRTLIDKMGGVNVCVERAFTDYKYPRNDDDKVDASYMTVKFEKGCQVLSGERAIEFARSRKSQGPEEGDFARSARQMKVIAAIKEEVLRKNLLGNALGYMDALQDNIRVSMDVDELFALASYFNSSEGKNIITNVKFDPEIMNGNNLLNEGDKGGIVGYVLVPQAGENHYDDIQGWTKRALEFATIRREQARLQILNASGIAGKAGTLSSFLEDRGFRQADFDIAPLEEETFLIDYTNGMATTNLNQLKQFLPKLNIITKTADKKPYDNAPDLILYLGKDYRGVVANGTSGDGTTANTNTKP